MNKNSLDFINIIEGYKLRVLEIHWSTDIDSLHQLTNDIYEGITDFQDKLVEGLQGYHKNRIEIGDIKPMLPNSKTLENMLNEMLKDLLDFDKTLTNDKQKGLKHLINGIIYNIDQWTDRGRRK